MFMKEYRLSASIIGKEITLDHSSGKKIFFDQSSWETTGDIVVDVPFIVIWFYALSQVYLLLFLCLISILKGTVVETNGWVSVREVERQNKD